MKKQVYALAVLSASLLLVACEGDDGVNGIDGIDGADGYNSLVATREIPKGDAECQGGGTALDSGLDTNRNGTLDPGEVTATEILECLVAPMVRALHASPDAPTVNILIDGEEVLSDVDYMEGSGFVPAPDWWFTLMVEANLPGDETLVIFNQEIFLDYNEKLTVLAVDYLEDNEGVPWWAPIWNPSDERITPDYFRAQIVHAAPSAPPVDVYVTAFDAELADSAPVTGVDTPLSFWGYTRPLEVLAGDYRIRITPAGDVETVVFDSGETPLTLSAGADLMIVAVDNVGPGDMPVQLVVMDGTTAFTLYDIDTPASVVAAHMSPDAPNVDLLADVVGTEEVEALPLVRDVGYSDFCDLAVPAPGVYTVSVVDTDDNSVVAHTIPFDVMKGDEAISIVSGFLADGETPAITDITLVSDTRSVFTEGKLRITHASPSTGAVDLYFVPDGTIIADVDPTFADVPFGGDTTQLSIAPGVYDVYVTAAGSKDPVFEEQDAAFVGGEVLDVIARDAFFEGEVGPQVFFLDYNALEGEEGYVPACPAPAEQ